MGGGDRHEAKRRDGLEEFLSTGIYRIPNGNALFLDPVRILNTFYSYFSISPSLYYNARALPRPRIESSRNQEEEEDGQNDNKKPQRKRKRKVYTLNEKEQIAEKRHKEIRPFLSSAYEAFFEDPNFSSILKCLKESHGCHVRTDDVLEIADKCRESTASFVEVGKLWQAPLYEMSLYNCARKEPSENGGETVLKQERKSTLPLFNSLVENKSNDDAMAECLCSCYVLPRQSSFLMSDLKQIHQLIPARSSDRYNLILLDPPWENKSVYRRAVYPTLPNRYLFSIPMRKLAHPEGALVALWVTNREKLRMFVEKDLFPAWGVSYAASLYWLKVTEDGHMLSNLDLPHHKPYECILLGYIHKEENATGDEVSHKMPLDKHVIISVPGDHSRKPPIGNLLLDYAPGPKPVRGVELFARELVAGWIAWGNEPLLFQHSKYFMDRRCQE